MVVERSRRRLPPLDDAVRELDDGEGHVLRELGDGEREWVGDSSVLGSSSSRLATVAIVTAAP
jgi:hypothetical protein